MMLSSRPDFDLAAVVAPLTASIDQLLQARPKQVRAIDLEELSSLSVRLQSARSGYPLLFEERASFQIDRLGSVFLGPVFTSEAYPWPEYEQAVPLVPLCQLNTAMFPRPLTHAVDGLIQVWLCPGDTSGERVRIRVVPVSDADASALSPIIHSDEDLEVLLSEAAQWLPCYHAGPRPTKDVHLATVAKQLGFATADELADANWDAWCEAADGYDEQFGGDVVMCLQLTAFDTERLYAFITADDHTRAAKFARLSESVADASTAAMLKSFVTAFEALVVATSESTFPCLYGTFDEIQYAAADCAQPLICMESFGLKEWGDGGNAQVFIEADSGFSFKWSCT